MIGHASGQELVRLVTELVDLQPRLVIALDGVNDALVSGFVPERSYGAGFNGMVDIERQLERHQRYLDPNPLRRVGGALPRLLFPNLMAAIFPEPVPTGQTPPARASEIYVRNVLKMRRVAEAFGAGFLCALQPLHPGIYGADFANRDKARFRLTRSLARSRFAAEQVEFIDLNDEPGLEPAMFLDAMHLDSRGNQWVARVRGRPHRGAGPAGGPLGVPETMAAGIVSVLSGFAETFAPGTSLPRLGSTIPGVTTATRRLSCFRCAFSFSSSEACRLHVAPGSGGDG